MSKVYVTAPATCTDLGPGLNSLGLALALHNQIEMSLRGNNNQNISVELVRSDAMTSEALGALMYLFNRALKAFFQEVDQPAVGVDILCEGNIPADCGLGEGSAWTICALVAINNLVGLPAPRDQIAALACKLTGQPAATIASLLGGLTAVSGADQDILFRRLEIAAQKVIVMVPTVTDYREKAFWAVPKNIPIEDIAFDIGRSVLVAEALRKGDYALLASAMRDQILEPARRGLIPAYGKAISAAKEAGAAATCLSGNGPALIIFAATNHSSIERAARNAFNGANVSVRAWIPNIDTQGVAISFQR